MNILYATYLLNGLLMISIPIGLAIYLTRKFALSWRLFWIGAATFLISQIIHIPFNASINPVFTQPGFISLPETVQTVILAICLGLSAGLFEELSRYAMYRWWIKDARSWARGLLVGTGHAGIEAIILGLLVLYGYIQMLAVRGIDISTLVAPDKLELARAQIQAYWSAPWYLTLLGALERLFTIPVHLACSLLVLQAFTRKNTWWLGLAILYHGLVDGVSVSVSSFGFSPLGIEAIIGIFAVISLFIIFSLCRPEPLPDIQRSSISPSEFKPAPLAETDDNLDKTRYQ